MIHNREAEAIASLSHRVHAQWHLLWRRVRLQLLKLGPFKFVMLTTLVAVVMGALVLTPTVADAIMSAGASHEAGTGASSGASSDVAIERGR